MQKDFFEFQFNFASVKATPHTNYKTQKERKEKERKKERKKGERKKERRKKERKEKKERSKCLEREKIYQKKNT